jgi:hypothetical protein
MKVLLIVFGLVAISLIILLFFARTDKSVQGGPRFSRIESQTETSKILNVPPRRMWGWGGWSNAMIGYCGESSFQICATYYGNYFSQEQVLKAGGGTFLLQTNDDVVCAKLHMTATEYFPPNNTSIYDMLKWVKQSIDQKYPIILGAFCNEPTGDPSFDHQVVIVGYDTGSQTYPETIYLNDTYNISHWPLDCSLGPYECKSEGATCPTGATGYYTGSPLYPVAPWPKCYVRRGDFSCSNSVQHAPYDIGIPNIVGIIDGPGPAQNAFLAVTGNVDPYNELYPCWLEMSSHFEPNWGIEDAGTNDQGDPAPLASPQPISCKVYIEKLTPGENYSLLRFDNPADVPEGKFIQGAYTFRQDFTPRYPIHIIEITHDPLTWPFMSNGTYFFRCVKNTAPIKFAFPYGTDRTDKALGHLPSSVEAMLAVRANLTPSQNFLAAKIRGKNNPNIGKDIFSRVNRWGFDLKNGILDLDRARKGGLISRMLRQRNIVPKKDMSSYKRDTYRRGADITKLHAPVTQCGPKNPTVDPQISCDKNGLGKIHPNWELTFPTGTLDEWGEVEKITCLPLKFKVIPAKATAANCVTFQITDPDNDTFADDGDTGCVGLDGNIYFEDYGDPFFYTFSTNGRNQDGTYTMTSQDGVTISILRPV